MENRFLEEDRRTHHYLSSQTTAPLLEILKSKLLSPHLSTVIMKEGSGLDTMIDNSKFEDLSRLFKLCIMVPTGLGSLSSALKGSILRRGKQVNEASSSDLFVEIEGHARETDKRKGKARPPTTNNQPALQWMQSVLDLKDRFDRMWKTSFQSNRELESSMNNVRRPVSTCSCLVNEFSRPSAYLSTWTRNVRSSSRCLSMSILRKDWKVYVSMANWVYLFNVLT